MPLTSEEIIQLTREAIDGVPYRDSKVAASADARTYRSQVGKEITNLRTRYGDTPNFHIALPTEVPSLDPTISHEDDQ
jgi:hypothetical protein